MKKIFQVSLFAVFLSNPCLAQEPVRSTIEDQKSVAVTVYNSDIGLVKDTRCVALPAGSGELRFA